MARQKVIEDANGRLALTEVEYHEVQHMLDDGDNGSFGIVSPYTWRDVEDALEELAEDYA